MAERMGRPELPRVSCFLVLAWVMAQHLVRPLIASRIMPRTTLDLDSSVLRELRRLAAREGKSMGTVASELVARALMECGRASAPVPLRWTSGDLGMPRVDLEDKEALQALLESGS